MLDGRDVDLTLAEEKRQLQHLNVGLAEKVAVMREAEATVVAKMQDFRYTSHIKLVFRFFRAKFELRGVIFNEFISQH